MDAWEWNKLAAAVLGALAFLMAVHFVAEAVFTVPPPSVPGYAPAEAPGGSDGAAGTSDT